MSAASPLIIRRVVGHVVEVRLNFTYSSGTLEQARSIIWEIQADGFTGLGECGISLEKSCPGVAAGLGGGTDAGLADALRPWAGPLIGRDARELEALLPELGPTLNWDLLVIREGLSIGLFDLVGRASGLPVFALLGGARRRSMPGMPVIHVGPTDVMVRRARKWAEGGFRFLKVKFRGRLDEDADALRAIRAAVGEAVGLAVDANAGYRQIDDALKAIETLAPCRVDYFEDMLDGSLEEMGAMRRLARERCGARIMVDRQATWPHIHDVVRHQAADVVNHHPDNQGGLASALAIDAVASAAGLQTAIGSSGIMGVQNAAFMHLACVIGLTRPCEDISLVPYFSGPTRGEYNFDYEPSVIRRGIPIEQGVIHVPDLLGLGVELDPQRLARCKVGEIEYR